VRGVGLRTISVIAAGAAVLAGVLFVASTVDARAPRVLEIRITQPAGDDPRRALITTSIEVTFNEPVVTDAAERAFEIDPRVAGTISWSGPTLTFTPDEALPLETAFVVSIAAGVSDPAGNRMAEPSDPFSFETAGRPRVLGASPEDGATDVPLDAPIDLTFSSLMDTASVESALTFDPAFVHELRWAGETLSIVPTNELEPDRRYEIRIAARASDVAGVELEREWELSFRTVTSALRPAVVVPADGTDGIALTTPIALLFDEPIDPDSVSSELLTVSPEIPGSLDVTDPLDGTDAGVLRFTPSGPLLANTTFSVTVAPGLRSADGDLLAVPTEWSFTTGSPFSTLSNQVIYLSDRSGITNLWAMNADGTGRRQVSAELSEVLDYAAAPDGRSFIVGDGRRLVLQSADGADRRVLTDEGVIEFDASYSADGRTLVFGRADAATGAGTGIWTRDADGGDPEPLPLPDELVPTSAPSASGEPSPGSVAGLQRVPRLAPDGDAVAFVEAEGRLVIADLTADAWVRADLHVSGPPVWLPDGSGVLVGMSPGPLLVRSSGSPVGPLDAADAGDPSALELVVVDRDIGEVRSTPFGPGAIRPSVATDGSVAYVALDADRDPDAAQLAGRLMSAPSVNQEARPVTATRGLSVAWVSSAPEPEALVISVVDEPTAAIWLLELDRGDLSPLGDDGHRARWLP